MRCLPGRFRPAMALALVATIVMSWPAPRVDAAIPACATRDAWVRVRTKHFTLVSNAGADQAREYARQLEWESEAIARRGRWFQDGDGGAVRVYAIDGPACFAPFRPSYGGKARHVLGFFQPSPEGGWLVIRGGITADAQGVIYHEFVHALVARKLAHVPTCINEGLAEFFSTFTVDAGVLSFGHVKRAWLQWLTTHTPFDTDRLFGIGTQSNEYNDGDAVNTFYAESWALVQYLNRTTEDGAKFDTFLDKLTAGDSPRFAFEAAYPGEDWPGLARRVRDYVDAGRLVVHELPLDHDLERVAMEVTPLDRVDALTTLGDLTRQLGGDAAAADYYRAGGGGGPPRGRRPRARGCTACWPSACTIRPRSRTTGGRPPRRPMTRGPCTRRAAWPSRTCSRSATRRPPGPTRPHPR
jgi:hypothetical protein